MSAKRLMEALVSGNPRIWATASAKGRLLLQATIFMSGAAGKGYRTGRGAGNRRSLATVLSHVHAYDGLVCSPVTLAASVASPRRALKLWRFTTCWYVLRGAECGVAD